MRKIWQTTSDGKSHRNIIGVGVGVGLVVVRGHPVNKTREYSGAGVNESKVVGFDWETDH